MQMELEDIQHHVERLREGWEKMRIGEGEYALRNAPNSKPTSYWNHSPASRNAMAQKISEAFASVIKKHDFRYIDEEMVLPYAASYAYSVDMEAAGDCEFSFTVAFRELKKLKSGKNSVTTERSFEDMKGPIAGFKRILSQMEV